MGTLRRLLTFLAPYRRGALASLALSWVAMGFTVAIPWLIGKTVDAVTRGDRADLLPLAAAMVGAALARLGLTFARRVVAGKVSLGVEFDLRNLMYRHLQSLELAFFDRRQTGQLMSRATVDLQAIRFFLGYGLIFITQNAVTIVLAAVVMFAIQPELALFALAPMPVVIATATRYGMLNRPATQEAQQRLAELTAEVEETVSGIRVVKAFAREDHRAERFRESVGRLFGQNMVSTRLRALYNPAIGFLPNLGLAVVLFAGGREVISGGITLGEFTAFYSYLMMLIGPMRTLGVSLGMAQRAIASGNRTFEILDTKPEMTSPARAPGLPAGEGAIELDGVTLRYGAGVEALHDVTLRIEAGETVALVGPTGSGKTSLAALVPRLYDASDGVVRVDGADVREVDLAALRGEIALVADESFLFTATVAENIAYAREDATREEVVEAARRAQAEGFIQALPDGYDTRVGERGYTLSGGQRQRLAIARALLADPRVLILDDATSSVDARTEERIKDGLREAMAGRTTIIVAHRLSTISLADRVVVLDGGRVVDEGTHDELVERCPLYGEMVQKGMEDAVFLQRDLEEREVAGL